MYAYYYDKGAGKTTLLNALGGRATYGEVSGIVTLGGRPLTSEDLNYVPQFDDHNERFTPRELLTYMKLLQVSRRMCTKNASFSVSVGGTSQHPTPTARKRAGRFFVCGLLFTSHNARGMLCLPHSSSDRARV